MGFATADLKQEMCAELRRVLVASATALLSWSAAAAPAGEDPAVAMPPSVSEATAPAPPAVAAPPAGVAVPPGVPAPAGREPAFTPAREPQVTAPPAEAPAPLGARATDPHVDRGLLLPTAEVQPADTWTFSSYEIAVLQVGRSFGDRTQVALTFVPVLGRDPIVPLDLSVKSVVHRGDAVRLAVIGSATGIAGFEQGALFLGRAGGAATLCLDEACGSTVNAAATLALAGPALILMDGFGVVARVSDRVALLGEIATILSLGKELGQANTFGVGGGVRFTWRRVALDLALEVPVRREPSLPVVPFLAFTYRTAP